MTAETPGTSSSWRRRNSLEGARTHRVEIKLNDEEYARAKAEATVRNCSMPAVFMSAWAADGAVAARRVEMLQDDLLAARRLMVRVSANLNQALKLEHTRRLENQSSGREFERDLQAVTQQLQVALRDIRRATEEVQERTVR